MKQENCPACGSTSHEPTGPEAPGFSGTVGEEKFEQENYFVRVCSSCGLLYRTVVLSEAELARYYAGIDFRKWATSEYHPTERCVLKILRTLPRGSRFLDFGCSAGRLLADLVPEYRCYGIEVNATAAGEAAKNGLSMISLGDLGTESPLEFDAIVLVDLIEHISQPLHLLRKLVNSLTEEGKLIIVTGDGDARACRRDPAQFWYFRSLEHLSMFTRKHAEFICSALNLDVAEWKTMSHYDLSFRERLVQHLQNFVYWEFRNRTLLARFVLKFLPGMHHLKLAKTAPTFSCTRDHVVAVFTRTGYGARSTEH